MFAVRVSSRTVAAAAAAATGAVMYLRWGATPTAAAFRLGRWVGEHRAREAIWEDGELLAAQQAEPAVLA